MSDFKGLKETIDMLSGLDLDAMAAEMDRLLEVERWAVASLRLGYGPGDRVRISSPEASVAASREGSGWYGYREALQIGNTGVAGEITFNRFSDRWQCWVSLDRAWRVTDGGLGRPAERSWRGPEGECPPGFRQGRVAVKVFSLDVRWLEAA